jgi:hypothetical protein
LRPARAAEAARGGVLRPSTHVVSGTCVPPPVYRRLPFAAQSAFLREIIGRCARKEGQPSPVLVFDLDGTLMDNRPRTCAILRELAAHWATRHPAHAAKLRAAEPDDLAYLLTESLEQLGVTQTEMVAEAETFWRERFFVDGYLSYDVPIPGAVEFVRAAYESGGNIVYLTGRDLPLMGIGSFRSLRDLGFPIGVPGTELVLKPDAAMPDEAFKRLEAPKLARVGKVVGVFDNEPANCNVLLEQNPGAESVFVDTQHLPGAPPLDPRVKVIGDFRTSGQ